MFFFISAVKPLSVKILGSREPLSAGKEYELVCQSIGARPPATITWWLGGEQLTNATSTVSSILRINFHLYLDGKQEH